MVSVTVPEWMPAVPSPGTLRLPVRSVSPVPFTASKIAVYFPLGGELPGALDT
jgi:hypothetical protein